MVAYPSGGSPRVLSKLVVLLTVVSLYSTPGPPACLFASSPALQHTTACFLLPALTFLPHSSQPSSPLPQPVSSPRRPSPFLTFPTIKPASFISTFVCVCVWAHITNHSNNLLLWCFGVHLNSAWYSKKWNNFKRLKTLKSPNSSLSSASPSGSFTSFCLLHNCDCDCDTFH